MAQTLGAASTRWTDYLGTAAADDADALANTRSIYELSGLDRDRWAIVAVDLFFGRTPQVAVYARPVAGSDGPGASDGAGASDAPVGVTQFRISDALQVAAFLDQAFRTVAVRLVTGAVLGQEIVVDEVVAL